MAYVFIEAKLQVHRLSGFGDIAQNVKGDNKGSTQANRGVLSNCQRASKGDNGSAETVKRHSLTDRQPSKPSEDSFRLTEGPLRPTEGLFGLT